MLEPFLAPLLGGVIIGLAAGGLYLLAGEIAGISGIVRIALQGTGRGWAAAFVAGLLAAGLAARAAPGVDLVAGIEKPSPAMLALAGLLVGIGTNLGNGCTSGHGVCGLSRLSKRSMVAVAVFMAMAALTVFVVRHGAGA